MIRILYEDEALLAVDKPAGALSVRGRPGEAEPALVDVLGRERGEELLVVHRIDRGTSGVLLYARLPAAQHALGQAFASGRVEKRYLALVRGEPLPEFTVDVPLVAARRGMLRPAGRGKAGQASASVTSFKTRERFKGFALLEAEPRAGRSQQIRVHLKYAGFLLAVDAAYTGVERLTRGELGLEPAAEVLLDRTPLHAWGVRLPHPLTGQPLTIDAPLPPDLEAALGVLRGLR